MALLMALSGCATTNVVDERDPWEGWNRKVHNFNDTLDENAMKPIAKAYRWITPDFINVALTNAFSNIDDIGVFVNDALQGKFIQSGLDFSRFLVNTTVGFGGLIDVASTIKLEKHNEDFGQTLGYWGVPTGPYVVLPLLGSSSARGAFGLVGDAAMNPLTYLAPYISIPTNATELTDIRADLLGAEKTAEEAAAFGEYEFYRNSYIDRRHFLVTDGVESEQDDLLLE